MFRMGRTVRIAVDLVYLAFKVKAA
jgi:hypothetical protein